MKIICISSTLPPNIADRQEYVTPSGIREPTVLIGIGSIERGITPPFSIRPAADMADSIGTPDSEPARQTISSEPKQVLSIMAAKAAAMLPGLGYISSFPETAANISAVQTARNSSGYIIFPARKAGSPTPHARRR